MKARAKTGTAFCDTCDERVVISLFDDEAEHVVGRFSFEGRLCFGCLLKLVGEIGEAMPLNREDLVRAVMGAKVPPEVKAAFERLDESEAHADCECYHCQGLAHCPNCGGSGGEHVSKYCGA